MATIKKTFPREMCQSLIGSVQPKFDEIEANGKESVSIPHKFGTTKLI